MNTTLNNIASFRSDLEFIIKTIKGETNDNVEGVITDFVNCLNNGIYDEELTDPEFSDLQDIVDFEEDSRVKFILLDMMINNYGQEIGIDETIRSLEEDTYMVLDRLKEEVESIEEREDIEEAKIPATFIKLQSMKAVINSLVADKLETSFKCPELLKYPCNDLDTFEQYLSKEVTNQVALYGYIDYSTIQIKIDEDNVDLQIVPNTLVRIDKVARSAEAMVLLAKEQVYRGRGLGDSLRTKSQIKYEPVKDKGNTEGKLKLKDQGQGRGQLRSEYRPRK